MLLGEQTVSLSQILLISGHLHGRMVHDTDIVELELKSKKFSLAVRKKEAVETPEPAYQVLCGWHLTFQGCAHMCDLARVI